MIDFVHLASPPPHHPALSSAHTLQPNYPILSSAFFSFSTTRNRPGYTCGASIRDNYGWYHLQSVYLPSLRLLLPSLLVVAVKLYRLHLASRSGNARWTVSAPLTQATLKSSCHCHLLSTIPYNLPLHRLVSHNRSP